MTTQIREILTRFDELGAYEFPRQFRYSELRCKTERVFALVARLGLRITLEGAEHNQDASFSIAILLHDFERLTPTGLFRPVIRFSNFGNLATITATEFIHESTIEKIVEILDANGFIYLSANELDADYDGVMQDRTTYKSWWIRYFDWL